MVASPVSAPGAPIPRHIEVARLDVDLRPRTRPVPGFTGSRFLSRQPGILAGRTIFRGTRARGQCLQGAGREKTLRCRGCGRSLPVAFLPTMIAAPITSAGRFSPRGPFGHCEPFTYGILLKGGASAFRGADKVPSNGTLCTLPATSSRDAPTYTPEECYFFTPRATRPPWYFDVWTRAHVTGETSTGLPA